MPALKLDIRGDRAAAGLVLLAVTEETEGLAAAAAQLVLEVMQVAAVFLAAAVLSELVAQAETVALEAGQVPVAQAALAL